MKKKRIELPSLWWAPVEGYEELYAVSVNGEMKSLKSGKILKPQKNKDGYLQVQLCKDGKGKTYKVHRLVATAFIDNPNNLPEVNHKDENKLNNHVENLEWCNRKYNANFGTAIQRRVEKQSKAVQAINPDTGEVVVEFPSTQEAGRNGYNHGNVAACCRGEIKSFKGLIWCFKGTSDEEIDRRITEYRSSGCSKSVVALDKQGRVIHVFPSIMEAGRNGFDFSAVAHCCRGDKGFKTHHGLYWYYQDDFLKDVC